MSVISHAGEDYGIPTVNIQDDASATTLDATKVPTGQTMNNVLNSNFVNKNWTKKTISLQNSALNSTSSITVTELTNASELVVCASNQQVKHNFIRVDDNIDTFVLNFDSNNANWRLAFNLSVDWTNKTISIVTYYKGNSQPYPKFDAVYYR